MKKIATVFIIGSALVSCKKDYVCECTITPGNNVDKFTIKNVSKSRAKANCVSSTWEDTSTNPTVKYEANCSLK